MSNKLDVYDVESYRKNPMEFYVVASDAVEGKPVYKKLETCDEHDLTWMRASASMPLVSTPVKIDGYTLLDGGMTDSIPLRFFESIGYERNVVILTQPKDFVKKPSSLMGLMRLMLKNIQNWWKQWQTATTCIMKKPDTALKKQKKAKCL